MNAINHVKAAYAALRLLTPDNAEHVVSRASWHIALANNLVAFGWGTVPNNELNALFLRAGHKRIQKVALQHKVYGAYQDQVTLNNHWRLPYKAPTVNGLPDTNVWNA